MRTEKQIRDELEKLKIVLAVTSAVKLKETADYTAMMEIQMQIFSLEWVLNEN